ncbi:hypothetical protein PAXRUDRAFT_63673, partial [Paxillus rubicundulus Ve08.2h10]
LTFHDVIVYLAQPQHTFLNIYSVMDFVEIVLPQTANPTSVFQLPHAMHTDWMGAFTTNMKVCKELFHAGMPIW